MCKIKISIVIHRTVVCYVVGLQTILGGTIEKERPSGRTISIGADTLDLEEISALQAEIFSRYSVSATMLIVRPHGCTFLIVPTSMVCKPTT